MKNKELENKKKQQIVNQFDIESFKENEIINNIKTEFESEKPRYFNYIGSFSGLIGFNTAVYILYNKFHDKYYVGETVNLQVRMITHYNNLDKGKSKNQELQSDFDFIKNKGENPFAYFEGQIVFRKYYQCLTSFDQVNEIQNDLINRERKEIARLIEKGNIVYNLSGLIGFPCIILEKFYPSISAVRKETGESFELIKAKLRNSKESNYKLARKKDIQKLGETSATFTTLPQPIILSDPILKKEKRFNSIIEAENFFKGLSKERKNEYIKKGVVISRKAISNKCKSQDKFYRYDD